MLQPQEQVVHLFSLIIAAYILLSLSLYLLSFLHNLGVGFWGDRSVFSASSQVAGLFLVYEGTDSVYGSDCQTDGAVVYLFRGSMVLGYILDSHAPISLVLAVLDYFWVVA
jgi:hypothetical protein